jgi:hypothetical protein
MSSRNSVDLLTAEQNRSATRDPGRPANVWAIT